MKTRLLTLLTLCLLGSVLLSEAYAQRRIYVTGTILQKRSGAKKAEPYPLGTVIQVYTYSTVARAEDDKAKIDNHETMYIDDYEDYITVNDDGTFQVLVSESGALIISIDDGKRIEMERVKGRSRLTLVYDEDITQELDEVEVLGFGRRLEPDKKAASMRGNMFLPDTAFIVLPEDWGAKNRRLVFQPYFIEKSSKQVMAYAEPYIFDGTDYHRTQERRMAFDLRHDSLSTYVDAQKTLQYNKTLKFWTKDTLWVADPQLSYCYMARVALCDYTHIVKEDTLRLSLWDPKRPLRFLEFTFPTMHLDASRYKETAKKEQLNTASTISLHFLLGKAKLDMDDPHNQTQLEKLEQDLMHIVQSEGASLKHINLVGFSSPDGRYARNAELSADRTNFALQYLRKLLGNKHWARLTHHEESHVATWLDVAQLLEKDGLTQEAVQVRSIVERYPQVDQQYFAIIRLPFYKSAIEERLPLLRTISYEYQYEIYRELSGEELWKRYCHDPQYAEGVGRFTKAEYWELFKMAEEKHFSNSQKEQLYRRAYHETMGKDRAGKQIPWALAANNYAVALLNRDTLDLTILDPLIDRTITGVDIMRQTQVGFETITTWINPAAIVVNQLAMYIRANNFEEASILSKMLPDTPTYATVKAFARCLGGYYDFIRTSDPAEKAQCAQTFQAVCQTTPRNNVIMHMAIDLPRYNELAEQALQKLDGSPLKSYLEIVLFARKNQLGTFNPIKTSNTKAAATACQMLQDLFKEDGKFREIMLTDGEFSEEFKDYFEAGEWELDLMMAY